jgi:hypothetical protein
MKSRKTPTDDEVLMASGKKQFEDSLHAEYLTIVEAQVAGIKEAFMKQQAKAEVRSPLFLFLMFILMFSFHLLGTLEPREI